MVVLEQAWPQVWICIRDTNWPGLACLHEGDLRRCADVGYVGHEGVPNAWCRFTFHSTRSSVNP